MKASKQHHWRVLVYIIISFTSLSFAQNLFSAIQAGEAEAFTAALQSGADINATDEYGQTPLMYAVTLNQTYMVETLIAAGAVVNAQTLAGWTALHYAARDSTETQILRILLDAGANPTARNHAGDTPHAVATTTGNHAAAETLETNAPTRATPHVTGTTTSLRSTEERQWITVEGSGFAPNAVVTLAWGDTDFTIPAERTEFDNPNSTRIRAGVYPPDATWTARVTNPDGTTSNRHSLQFETPRATQSSATWPPLLGTLWTGPQAVLDHPLCTEAGCRYLRAEPVELQGSLYFTVFVFGLQQRTGVTLELVVNGPRSSTPNRIAILGVRIADANRNPVRNLSALIAKVFAAESQGTVEIDAVDLCVDSADLRDAAGTLTTRRVAGLSVNCGLNRVNVLTGQRLPSPTFMLDVSLPD